MKLYCIRHGQTDYNKERRTQGSTIDTHLNETGKQQVRDQIKNIPPTFSAIIASPMLRARESAEIIAEFFNKPVTFNSKIVEFSLGSLAGKTWDEIIAETGDPTMEIKDVSCSYDYRPYGGESALDMRFRINEFIVELKANFPSHSELLIVTHGGVIEALEFILEGKTRAEAQNAGLYIFEL